LLAAEEEAAPSFWASLGPSDYVTAGIAILALLVSAINVIQNHRFQPRPHIEVTWDSTASENRAGVLVIGCYLTNDGDTVARNVKIAVRAPGMVDESGVTWWARWPRFSPDEHSTEMLELPLEPCVRTRMSLTEADLLPLGDRLPVGTPRTGATRPVVTIWYRGRLWPVRSKAPVVELVPRLGGC